MAICFSVCKRFLSTSRPRLSNVFNHVTVVGGGIMGSGIAQVTAQSGIDVTIIEVNEEAIKKADANIKSSIQRVAKKLFQNSSEDAEKYIEKSVGRVKISLDLNETVAKTDLVVEAIVENMESKHKLFSRIDSIAPQHTIFASNTSSLPIGEIAAVTKRKDRFGGLHFFNPVPMMKLLEVIRTEDTSDDTYQKMMAWGKAIGKTTITCKDTPGFVVNRLLIPYLSEATKMLERGDASAKDIDVAMKLGAGYPMGPFELLDYVGLDTTKFILEGWHAKYPENASFEPPNVLRKLVAEGKLGRKTGEGFYTYKKSPGFVPLIHTPYFQPLPPTIGKEKSLENNDDVALPSGKPLHQDHHPHHHQHQHQHRPRETCAKAPTKIDKMKKTKSERNEGSQSLPKSEKLEKLKKLDRLKCLEKWKNSEEFIKLEREKTIGKRHSKNRKTKPFDNYINRDTFKSLEKSKNLEDFIRFEREKDFRLFRTTS